MRSETYQTNAQLNQTAVQTKHSGNTQLLILQSTPTTKAQALLSKVSFAGPPVSLLTRHAPLDLVSDIQTKCAENAAVKFARAVY